ncbi:MAG: hypothetical protein GWN01_10320 [Nitrosopumilaceae archaeon]|nr:hypothetical protein [Nitrosopumilaceae archaeon]NIU01293.1 hypothetical protein [Nitrosopumilaceae archaeon]NIU87641.1 hypothetical protein [Nitrosopumilaceae archaeon]NIV66066.1 hypothetical protein [Nitrosopumilaceae archaeon]NIX61895.1 hypothetical protein [Nitrosopumilaceae archaeon]
MELEVWQELWFVLHTIPLTIETFTEQIAILTTQITAIVIALAALTWGLGVAFQSTPITRVFPSVAEHGATIKSDALKGLFNISIYGGIVNLVVWTASLLNSIGE